MNLSKNTKLSQAVTVTNGAAGSTNINGATLDMQNFRSVLIRVTFGAIVAGAATSIKAQQGAADPATTDLKGTSQTVLDTDDEKIFYIDLVKPTKRYVRLVVLRATQDSTVEATYLQYNPRKMPTTHGTNVSGETHISPDEGTP